MNCVKSMVKKHCYSEIEIEEDIIVIYYYSGEEHANKDKGRTSVFPLNRHIFSQSKVEYRVSTSVVFNILTRKKIFTEDKASRLLTFVKLHYSNNMHLGMILTSCRAT